MPPAACSAASRPRSSAMAHLLLGRTRCPAGAARSPCSVRGPPYSALAAPPHRRAPRSCSTRALRSALLRGGGATHVHLGDAGIAAHRLGLAVREHLAVVEHHDPIGE